MKLSNFTLFVAIIASLFNYAYSAEVPENVHVLTDANFSKTTKSGKWFVMFYAPWCGHCTRLQPTWMKLADAIGDKVNIGMVDGTVNKKVAQEFQIRGYPTVILMNNGQKKYYESERSLEALSAFALNELSSSDTATMPDTKSVVQAYITMVQNMWNTTMEMQKKYSTTFMTVCTVVFFFGYMVGRVTSYFTSTPKYVQPSPPSNQRASTKKD